ncbi:MAG: DUF2784 domain-containing protein [Humidesulfovibrio sp.]|uniref:DUF2784 domain-containing protein n=1 Tax=Humidesulfovibrio sp. TaxID=2910988 RepID=UPI0027FF2850|nr:DUF2784 domain-containing protein [Humidesulfovibrio sp.]MDQ7835677.1 DUF2784 domain-containing protein [Humidesulfovibrio sp.]
MPTDAATSLLLADIVLVLHTALALFLTFGLAAIWLGGWLGWGFVRNRGFRLAHLAGLAVVALESVLGLTCPLTDLESGLRNAAHATPGAMPYRGGFIAHWLGKILYYDLDERVFLALYLAALGLTLLAWRVVRVRGRKV